MDDLVTQLQREIADLRREMRGRFDRHVPLADLIIDRFETAAFYGFGDGSSCYNSVLIIGDVIVGDRAWIGPNAVLDGSGGLTIGSDVAISAGAQIYTHNSVDRTRTQGRSEIVRRPTVIGSGVYIGPNAVVEMGVTIGDGAVVGALTLVRQDVPPGARCYGVPGRVFPP